MGNTIKDIALEAAAAASDKKANDIQILDVKELTIIADYFLICSGNSATQVKSISNAIQDKLSEKDVFPKRVAGREEGRWILIDYADLIIHVFHEDERKYYELERLWADAKNILSNT